MSYRDEICTSLYYFDGELGDDLFKGYGTYVFIMHYSLPAVLFVVFYGRYNRFGFLCTTLSQYCYTNITFKISKIVNFRWK